MSKLIVAAFAIVAASMAVLVNVSTFNPWNDHNARGLHISRGRRNDDGAVLIGYTPHLKYKSCLVTNVTGWRSVIETADNGRVYPVTIQPVFGMLQISRRNSQPYIVAYLLPWKNRDLHPTALTFSYAVTHFELHCLKVGSKYSHNFYGEVRANRRGLSYVLKPEHKLEVATVGGPFKRTAYLVSYGDPWPLFSHHGVSVNSVSFNGGLRGSSTSVGSTPILPHGSYEKPSSSGSYKRGNAGNPGLKKCQSLLPHRSLGGFPLGVQVGIFTLLGAASFWISATAAACLLGLVYRDGPRYRWLCWSLILLFFPAGVSLYSLASMGDWRAVWWLCEL